MRRKHIVFLLAIALMCGFIANRRIQTSFLFEAIEEMDYNAAQVAIKRGANVNGHKHVIYIPDVVLMNPTPLVQACKVGDRQLVELLISSGANINQPDKITGKTPLLAALHGSKNNRFSLAMYIIECGADIHLKQDANSAIYETLVVLDSDPEQTIDEGFELFRYLVDNGVDMELFLTRENVLTFAAHYNNFNVVEYLLQHGFFEVDDYDEEGNTALTSAVKYNHIEIVELLIGLGANKSLTDKDGNSAMDYALINENEEMVNLLKE